MMNFDGIKGSDVRKRMDELRINAHEHELGQGFSIKDMEAYVYCKKCKRKWAKSEIERLLTAIDRMQERAERVLEGEDWNLPRFVLELIRGER